jgi:exodeoxyribonuclease VII small subunit
MKNKRASTNTFEKTLSRLMEVADAMEQGDASLDESMALYKEGLALAKTCGEWLNRYEAEVTLLQKESEDVFTQKVFPEE